jgi:hypothetical protein
MRTKLDLPDGLAFRGLRKSAVVMLLEAGCTDAEVSAHHWAVARTEFAQHAS